MSLCKSGQIQNCCHPNALMTLKEYLEDYAAPGTKEIGEKLIQAEIGSIPQSWWWMRWKESAAGKKR